MKDPDFVVVYKASGELEAQVVKGRLTSAGIPAMFQNEALGTLEKSGAINRTIDRIFCDPAKLGEIVRSTNA